MKTLELKYQLNRWAASTFPTEMIWLLLRRVNLVEAPGQANCNQLQTLPRIRLKAYPSDTRPFHKDILAEGCVNLTEAFSAIY